MTMTVLIVDDEANARKNVAKFLTAKEYEVVEAPNLEETRKILKQGSADVILLDVKLPDGSGADFLTETARLPLRPPIILLTAFGDIDMAVEAMRNGAHDFLQKPIKLEQVENSIRRAGKIVAMRRELEHFRRSQQDQNNFVLGESTEMVGLFDQAKRAAEASVSILITGETGSGKEVLARAIHSLGPRKDKPYIAINCATIQSTMLESELFGHEAGAFTSADKRKHGLLEVADGGVLFLDEISTMPPDMQAKLLRVLEEHEFRRVGGTSTIKVDVQVLAASNRDLMKMIESGQFRDDLYYRLKVVDLHMPPLRKRKQDIPSLVGFFIGQNNPRMGLNIQDITPQAMEALVAYDWPGNIRELRNAIERAMLFCDDAVIDLTHLPAEHASVA